MCGSLLTSVQSTRTNGQKGNNISLALKFYGSNSRDHDLVQLSLNRELPPLAISDTIRLLE